MEPIRIDVSEILGERATQIDIDSDVQLEEIVAGDNHFAPEGPATLSGMLVNAGDGIVLTGTVTVPLRTECSRCLSEFTLPVTGELEGLFTTADKGSEIPEEQEWELLGDGFVDIAHAVDAAIRLELPFAPVHDEGCEGICTRCGADLNEGPCECDPVERDAGPFGVLKDLFPQEEPADE